MILYIYIYIYIFILLIINIIMQILNNISKKLDLQDELILMQICKQTKQLVYL